MNRHASERPNESSRSSRQRRVLPFWPRLLREEDAANYLSIGPTSLRKYGPRPRHLGRRILYDRLDLDRWADSLSDIPLDEGAEREESQEVERRFLERFGATR